MCYYCLSVHSGLVAGLGSVVEDAMVTLCWTGSNAETFMKILKFIELSASNMFAVTNLAICVNLALVVSVSSEQRVATSCYAVGVQSLTLERKPNSTAVLTKTLR